MSKRSRSPNAIDDSSNRPEQVTVYEKLGEAAVTSQLELVRQALERIPNDTIIGADQDVIAGHVTNALGEEGAIIATFAREVIESPNFRRNTTLTPDQLASSVASMIKDLLKKTPHIKEDTSPQQQDISSQKGKGGGYLKEETLSQNDFLSRIEELEQRLLQNTPTQADAIRQEISTLKQVVAGLNLPILEHAARAIKGNIEKLGRKYNKNGKPEKKKKRYYSEKKEEISYRSS